MLEQIAELRAVLRKATAQLDALEAEANKQRTELSKLRLQCASRKPRPAAADLELLGLGAAATQAELRTAYAELARQHHPDAGGDREEYEVLVAAYQRLKSALPE